MALANSGRDFIASAIIGEAVAPFNNANARIGIGDGTTAFAKTQTDLMGTNKLRQKMDASFPVRASNKLTFKASFSPTEGNFAWQEWGVFNAATGGVMLNRSVENNGVKSGGSWAFTVELELVN